MAVCFLIQAGHGPYYTFFSIYLEEHGYSNSFIGTCWALGVLAEVIIYVFIHKVIGRFGLTKADDFDSHGGDAALVVDRVVCGQCLYITYLRNAYTLLRLVFIMP